MSPNFAAQVSGPGLLVWTDAGTLTGDAGTQTFNVPANTQQVALSQNRVYTHDFAAEVLVWNNASTFTAARAPDHGMDGGSNLSGIRHIAFGGNTLVLTQRGL